MFYLQNFSNTDPLIRISVYIHENIFARKLMNELINEVMTLDQSFLFLCELLTPMVI